LVGKTAKNGTFWHKKLCQFSPVKNQAKRLSLLYSGAQIGPIAKIPVIVYLFFLAFWLAEPRPAETLQNMYSLQRKSE